MFLESSVGTDIEDVQIQSSSVTENNNEIIFLDICNSLDSNNFLLKLPKNWIFQVILNGLKCLMFTLWKSQYSAIEKRIVLFSDMSCKVHKNFFYN